MPIVLRQIEFLIERVAAVYEINTFKRNEDDRATTTDNNKRNLFLDKCKKKTKQLLFEKDTRRSKILFFSFLKRGVC